MSGPVLALQPGELSFRDVQLNQARRLRGLL